jgi:hypothetical protein
VIPVRTAEFSLDNSTVRKSRMCFPMAGLGLGCVLVVWIQSSSVTYDLALVPGFLPLV